MWGKGGETIVFETFLKYLRFNNSTSQSYIYAKGYISPLGSIFSEFLVNKGRGGVIHFFTSTKVPLSIAALLQTSNLAMNISGKEVLCYNVVHLHSLNWCTIQAVLSCFLVTMSNWEIPTPHAFYTAVSKTFSMCSARTMSFSVKKSFNKKIVRHYYQLNGCANNKNNLKKDFF